MPENVIRPVFEPLHTTKSEGAAIVGVGLTVITNVFGEPSQLTDPLL